MGGYTVHIPRFVGFSKQSDKSDDFQAKVYR